MGEFLTWANFGYAGVAVIILFIGWRAWKNRKPGNPPKTGGGKPFEPK